MTRLRCRRLGHLPRLIIKRHPTKPGATIEACLRCGVVLCRHDGGSEHESTTYALRDGQVVRIDRGASVNA